MYRNENACACEEALRPTMELRESPDNQICNKANELLCILREIGCMTARIDTVLFSRNEGDKKCEPTPCCLAENLQMAMDEARVIAKTLDKIIQRL